MLIGGLDPAGVRSEHGERVPHDEHPHQVFGELGGCKRLLVVAGRRIVIAEGAVRVAKPLMNEGDASKVADLVGPLERALVIGRRRLRLTEILSAAAQSDEDP